VALAGWVLVMIGAGSVAGTRAGAVLLFGGVLLFLTQLARVAFWRLSSTERVDAGATPASPGGG